MFDISFVHTGKLFCVYLVDLVKILIVLFLQYDVLNGILSHIKCDGKCDSVSRNFVKLLQ